MIELFEIEISFQLYIFSGFFGNVKVLPQNAAFKLLCYVSRIGKFVNFVTTLYSMALLSAYLLFNYIESQIL